MTLIWDIVDLTVRTGRSACFAQGRNGCKVRHDTICINQGNIKRAQGCCPRSSHVVRGGKAPESLSSPAPVAAVAIVVPGHNEEGCHGDAVSPARGVRVAHRLVDELVSQNHIRIDDEFVPCVSVASGSSGKHWLPALPYSVGQTLYLALLHVLLCDFW
jgi:hypothetical protein